MPKLIAAVMPTLLFGVFVIQGSCLAQARERGSSPAQAERASPISRAERGSSAPHKRFTHKHLSKRTKKTHPVNERKRAEDQGYKKVSSLVNFPNFFPGLGIIYVKPDTLPTGPFLCFDRQDRLVATVYMIPIKDVEDHKTFENLAGFVGKADHVTLYFNSGHPGVDVPHYHFVIWHVSKQDEALVAH